MLRVLGRANSFNVRKVLWACDEIGVPFERGLGRLEVGAPSAL